MKKNIPLYAVVNFCAALMIEHDCPECKAVAKMAKTFSLSEEEQKTLSKCIIEKVLNLSYDSAPGAVIFDDGDVVSITNEKKLLDIYGACLFAAEKGEKLTKAGKWLQGSSPATVAEVIQEFIEKSK